MKNILIEQLAQNSEHRKNYLSNEGDELIKQMLHHIGNTDAEIRDQLNYRFFIECLSEQLFSFDQMNKMTLTLYGNDFLYCSIGEQNTDTVFTRSFSALWLSHLLYADAQLHFLTEEEAKRVLESASNYLMKEQDIRGFVDGKGWAHSIAHGSDLACAIVSHPQFELRLAPVLLQGVKESFWKQSVFTDDEEERLVKIVEKLIDHQFPEEVIVEWVEQLFDKLELHLMEVGYTPQFFQARTNTLHFMKTFYFSLKFSRRLPQLMAIVSLFISKWMK